MQAVGALCDSGWVWHNAVHIEKIHVHVKYTYMYTQVYIYITYACGGLEGHAEEGRGEHYENRGGNGMCKITITQ